jgi:hypothetical protein
MSIAVAVEAEESDSSVAAGERGRCVKGEDVKDELDEFDDNCRESVFSLKAKARQYRAQSAEERILHDHRL